MPLRGKKIGLL